MPLKEPAYILGAIRDLLAARESKIMDSLVMHADANQIDAVQMFMAVARISELRGLRRDLEREARQEIDRIGRAADGDPSREE